MIALLSFFLTLLVSPLKSKFRLEAENTALRHQLIVLQRRVRGRVQLTNGDRLFFVQLYRWFPSVCVLKTRFGNSGDEGRRGQRNNVSDNEVAVAPRARNQ